MKTRHVIVWKRMLDPRQRRLAFHWLRLARPANSRCVNLIATRSAVFTLASLSSTFEIENVNIAPMKDTLSQKDSA